MICCCNFDYVTGHARQQMKQLSDFVSDFQAISMVLSGSNEYLIRILIIQQRAMLHNVFSIIPTIASPSWFKNINMK